MFTPFETGLFLSCIVLAVCLAFVIGFVEGQESEKKKVCEVFKKYREYAEVVDILIKEVKER